MIKPLVVNGYSNIDVEEKATRRVYPPRTQLEFRQGDNFLLFPLPPSVSLQYVAAMILKVEEEDYWWFIQFCFHIFVRMVNKVA